MPRHYTRVALLEDNCGSVCLANQATVQNLAKQDGFQLVSTQIDQVGATDVTPQVLAMLAAKPQIILFGLVPGTDSITAIRAIRAQSPTIPISECSACDCQLHLGGRRPVGDAEHLRARLHAAMADRRPAGHLASEKATAAGLEAYMAGMKAAGLGNDNAIDNSQEGWDAGLEINWAITQAGNLDETTIMQNSRTWTSTRWASCGRGPVQLRELQRRGGRHGNHQLRRLGHPLQVAAAKVHP